MNQNKKNSIGKNVLHLFISTTLSRALNAAALMVLAKYFNSYQYGMFSVALAFAMVMGYFTDAGLSNTVLREGSRQNSDLQAIVASYIRLRIFLLMATFLGAFIIIRSLYGNNELAHMTYYLIIPMVLGLAMQSIGITYFQLTEQMHYLGAIRIWSSVLLCIMIGIGMILSVQPYIMSFLFGISYFLAGLYGLYMVHTSIGLTMKHHFQRGLLDNIWSFIISGLLIMLLPQMGPLVLEKTITLKQIGIFAVAYRIPSALYQIPGIIGGAFYPVLFKHYSSNRRQEHARLSILQVKIMGIIGIMITIPIFHLSGWIIKLLFGEKWMAAAEPLRMLSILLILQGISVALADGLTTQGLQTRRTIVQFSTTVIGAALYWILSTEYNITGAVYAALSIEILALLGFWMLSPNRWDTAKQALLPYISLFSVILLCTGQLFGAFPIAAIIISFALLTLILIDKELRETILHHIKKQKEQRITQKNKVHSA